MRRSGFRRRYVGVCIVIASAGVALAASSASWLAHTQAAEASPQVGENRAVPGCPVPACSRTARRPPASSCT